VRALFGCLDCWFIDFVLAACGFAVFAPTVSTALFIGAEVVLDEGCFTVSALISFFN
jgi:hypothetical protein